MTTDYIPVRRDDVETILSLCEQISEGWLPTKEESQAQDRLSAALNAEPVGKAFLVSALVSRPIPNGITHGHRAARVLANNEGEALGWLTAQWVVDGYSLESYDIKELDAYPALSLQPASGEGKLREALQAARSQLITLGGDPRKEIRESSTADQDEIQAAVLDLIDAALKDTGK